MESIIKYSHEYLPFAINQNYMRKRSKRINDADYIGKTFNFLTVVDTEALNIKGKQRKAICKCVCGKEVRATFHELRIGHSKSCGCLKKQKLIEYSTTHGMAKHPLTPIYSAMIQRCTNPKNAAYKDYGARGISVCNEWRNSIESFFSWAISNGWKDGLQIDRRDNNKGYYPGNCRLVSSSVNARNKRNNRAIEYKGAIKSLAEWCDVLEIPYQRTITSLWRQKLSAVEAFERPNRYKTKP